MRCTNAQDEIPTGSLRREQVACERNVVSGSGTDGGGDLQAKGDLPIGTDRAVGAGSSENAIPQSESERDRTGRGYSVRLRINPATHGGTLGLLIKKTERRKQGIRRSMALLEDHLNALRIELEQETEDLQELKILLANWQSNIDRLKEIRAGELNYTEGSE